MKITVDELIREIALGTRTASAQDVRRIREHVASAPFSTQMQRVPVRERGLVYHRRVVQAREDSAFIHLVRRVVSDKQWADGTSLEDYVADLQRIANDPASHGAIYDLGRGPVATFVGPNRVPMNRLGTEFEPYVAVIYAVHRRGIISGYQVSSLSAVDIPGDTKWLT